MLIGMALKWCILRVKNYKINLLMTLKIPTTVSLVVQNLLNFKAIYFNFYFQPNKF